MEMKSFINTWLASWTGNQPEKLLEFYTDDCFYADPAKRKGISGKENLKPYFERLLSANPDWIWTAVEIIPTEKGCTLKWQAEIPLGDKILVETGLDIVELREGKISRNEVWFDRLAWLKG